MANIHIDQFKGLMPRIHPASLPLGMAQVAHNLLLKNTKIVPLRNTAPRGFDPEADGYDCIMLENGLDSIDNAKTIYAWRRRVLIAGTLRPVTTILAWPGHVTVAKSNLADDERDRIFVSGETGIPYESGRNEPCVYFNNRDTGEIVRVSICKEKPPKPVVAVNQGGDADKTTERYATYFQTWVDSNGYESPCSDPSDILAYNDGDSVHIEPCDPGTERAVTRRIYRTVTGDNTEDNRFVIEYTGRTAWGAHDFALKDELVAMSERMPMVKSPPVDLEDMQYVPGCYYAGFSKSSPHTVMFTEISKPYNWTEEFHYDIHDNIVGLATTKNTVYALTDNCVWILRGTDPSTMVASALSPAACVSRRSICIFNNTVYFATNYGLCAVTNSATDGDIVVNLTDKFLTKDQWKALKPETCHITQFDGRLYAFFEGARYVFDLTEQECMLTTHDEAAECACVSADRDLMFLAGGGVA